MKQSRWLEFGSAVRLCAKLRSLSRSVCRGWRIATLLSPLLSPSRCEGERLRPLRTPATVLSGRWIRDVLPPSPLKRIEGLGLHPGVRWAGRCTSSLVLHGPSSRRHRSSHLSLSFGAHPLLGVHSRRVFHVKHSVRREWNRNLVARGMGFLFPDTGDALERKLLGAYGYRARATTSSGVYLEIKIQVGRPLVQGGA